MPTDHIFTRYEVELHPDPSRTVLRPFEPGDVAPFEREVPRQRRIADRIIALDDHRIELGYNAILKLMRERHRDVDAYLRTRSEDVCREVGLPRLDERRAALIGAFFSEEYAFQSAALFNPSAILSQDQSGLKEGQVRLVIALRGIGEGHVSSVTFRGAVWTPGGELTIDKASSHCQQAHIDKLDGDIVRFSWPEPGNVSEAVLFPVTAAQRQGIEDLRLTRFIEDDGEVVHYGTYTAFSGSEARSELVRSVGDLATFELRPLTGLLALNKGMALFPRRIGGSFMMLGRADNECLWLLRSDDVYRWDEGRRIASPKYDWEIVQIGNCGPPIELDEGWLVLTHGVGAMRSYSIGALLLDKDQPDRILARTAKPLLTPRPDERGGYVPNVVYSCGSIVVDRTLLLPYAVADQYTAFASAKVDDILAQMT